MGTSRGNRLRSRRVNDVAGLIAAFSGGGMVPISMVPSFCEVSKSQVYRAAEDGALPVMVVFGSLYCLIVDAQKLAFGTTGSKTDSGKR